METFKGYQNFVKVINRGVKHRFLQYESDHGADQGVLVYDYGLVKKNQG